MVQLFFNWRDHIFLWILIAISLLLLRIHFLVFHTLIELASIIIAITLSAVAWYTYRFSQNHLLMWLGCGYFWVALLDLLHTLTYQGMPDIFGTSVNHATQFWIAARGSETLLLLVGSWFIQRKVPRTPVFISFGLIAASLAVLIFAGYFPACFIPGYGLTDFKIAMEYAIVALLGLTFYRFWQQRQAISGAVYRYLVLALGCTAAAELAFTLYQDPYGFSNLIGHLFKLVSYWFIFLSIVRPTLHELLLSAERSVLNAARLQESETRYRELFEHNHAVQLLIDPEQHGAIVAVNKAAEVFYGHSKAVLETMRISDLNTLTPIEVKAEMQRAKTEQRNHFFFQHRLASGEVRDVEVHSGPVTLQGRGLLYSIVHDITDRKTAERQLAYTLDQLQQLYEAVDESLFGFYVLNADGLFTYVNKIYLTLWGYDNRSEVIGLALDSQCADSSMAQQLIAAVNETGRGDFQLTAQRKDGSQFEVFMRVTSHRRHDGVLLYHGFAEDMTVHIQMTQALGKTEATLNAVLENNPDMICARDREHRLIYFNTAFDQITRQLLQRPAEIGMDTFVVLPAAMQVEWKPILARLLAGESYQTEFELPFSAEDQRWFNLSLTPIQQGSDIIGYSEFIQDITKRKATENYFRIFEQMVSSTADLMSYVDTQYCYQMVNEAYVKLFRKSSKEEIIGRYVSDLVGETAFNQRIKPKLDQCLAGHVMRYEYLLDMPEGKRYMDVANYPVYDLQQTIIGVVNSVREITQHKRMEQALRESEAQLLALIENSQDTIVRIDRQLRFLYMNPVGAKLLDRGLQHILGKTVEEIGLPLEVCEYLNYHHQKVFATGQGEKLDFTLPLSVGVRHFQSVVNPEIVENGEVQTISGIVRDVTEYITAKQAAEAANRAKSAFLANMSHELRTPLNAVLGFAQVLQRDPELSELQHRQVDKIKRSGDYLLTLINDILDLTKIEAGRFELNPSPCELAPFFTELHDVFRLRAEHKGIAFDTQGIERLPAEVTVDEKRLRQICMNLLGNALKFTDHGHVCLAVAYQQTELHIQVQDTGLGIAPDKLETIFQPFSQVGEEKYKQQGTGLGLSISRSLVQQMGGEMTVTSTLGKGSCFTVTLPVPLVQTASMLTLTTRQSPLAKLTNITGYQRQDGSSEPFTILTVDDNEANRNVLQALLRPLGFVVNEAINGKAAVALTATQQFDVILMDLVMPELDGLSATRRILARSGSYNRQIIALTARSFAEDRQQSLAAGCCEHLNKPVDANQLLTIFEHLLPLRWNATDGATLPAPVPTLPAIEAGPVKPSAAWLAQLEQAVLHGKQQKMLQLVKELEPQQVELSAKLNDWLSRYQYEQLLAWIMDMKGQANE